MTFFLGCASLSMCSVRPCANSTYVREADRQVTEGLYELALLIVRICFWCESRVRLTRGPVTDC